MAAHSGFRRGRVAVLYVFTTGCLATSAIAVALIQPGDCHVSGPEIQLGVMTLGLCACFLTWFVAGAVALGRAPLGARLMIATPLTLQAGAAAAIVVFYGHQTAHYFACG